MQRPWGSNMTGMLEKQQEDQLNYNGVSKRRRSGRRCGPITKGLLGHCEVMNGHEASKSSHKILEWVVQSAGRL